MNSLINKKIAIFGINSSSRSFIDYMNKNNIKVVILDTDKIECNIKSTELTDFNLREKINWSELECLVITQEELCLVEEAKRNNCPVFSIMEFFCKYFDKYNYIGLIGDSGSSISINLIRYIFCKMKINIDYDFCVRENYFTFTKFGKTKDYVFDINSSSLKVLQSPHFNNIILFDLDYDKANIKKIKNMFLKQTDNDFAIFNIDNKEVKELYNSLTKDENYKAKSIPISAKKILKNGISFVNNEIYINTGGKNDEYLTNEFKNLNGEQNKINVLAVISLFAQNNFSVQEIIENLYNFKGVDDIFEKVLHRENFTFVNDIKNKNKAQSLITFDNIYWILCIDKIEFEFNEFAELKKYFGKLKYVFLIGSYDDGLLEIFKENNIKYFIMYDMKSIFEKINGFICKEKKEEKITILLSSINYIENSVFYKECSVKFEKLLNLERE